MQQNIRYIIIFTGLIIMLCSKSIAQSDSISNPENIHNFLTFDKLNWHNTWLGSTNAAGLRYLNSITDFKGLSEAEINYTYSDGKFRSVYDPVKYNDIGFRTQAIRKINNAFVSGYFRYDLENRTDVQWNGLYLIGSNPFFMADSIKGRFRMETFRAGVKYAQPLGSNHTIGLSADYIAAKGAKNKDLRNENMFMDFVIRPAWMWQINALSIGLDAGYHRTLEEITYQQIQPASNTKTFFQFYGNWFYISEVYTAQTDNKRIKTDNILDGHLQLQYQQKNISLHNEFGMAMHKSFQKNSAINNKQFGDVETLSLTDKLIVHLFNNHRLSASYIYQQTFGFRVLQREESDPITSNRIWMTYDRYNNYIASENMQTFSYSWLYRRNGMDISWQVDAGVALLQRTQKNKMYPYEFMETLSTEEYFLSANKNFRFGKSIIDISPLIAYGTGSGNNKIIKLEENPSLEISDNWQLHEYQKREFNFLTSERIHAQMRLQYSYRINNKGMRAFVYADYIFIKPLDDMYDNEYKNYITAGIGMMF